MPVSDLARAAEDRFHRDMIPVLRRRSWRPRAIPYDGYGLAACSPSSAGTARVMARMVMRPPHAPAEGPLLRHLPDSAPSSAAEVRSIALDSWLDAQRGWRQFIDVPVPYLPVTVTLGAARVRTRTDRGGYLDVALRGHDLGPGWHEAQVTVPGSRPVSARVHLIPTGPHLGVVCDVDDTIMVSEVPRALIAAWNLLMLTSARREAVPGMARLLTQVLTPRPHSPLIYLSTGAWNVVPTLRSFLARHDLPRAPMLMTDWGPTNTGWFRSGPDHKRTALRRLLIDLPEVTWLLVGDDGQHDPLIYSELARQHPDRVTGIAIRRLSQKEQVMAGTALANPAGMAPSARALAEAGVPVVTGRDGAELLARLTWALPAVVAGH